MCITICLKRDADVVRGRRFHSFLALLALTQDFYLFDLFACVSPAILFEAGGKRDNLSVGALKNLLLDVEEAMAEVGLAIHFVGFDHPKDLQSVFKKIAYDEVQIRKAIDEVVAATWKRDFSNDQHGFVRIPFSLAVDETPDMQLKYFRPWFVPFIFAYMIEKRMYRENKEQPKARRMMSTVSPTTFSILKSKGDGVEGLGDIELLTYCDLVTQTGNNSSQIVMGLTYDERLYDTLMQRSGIIATGPMFEGGGDDDPDDFSRALVWSMRHEARRTRKANQRIKEYTEQLVAFHHEVLGEFIPWLAEDKKGTTE